MKFYFNILENDIVDHFIVSNIEDPKSVSLDNNKITFDVDTYELNFYGTVFILEEFIYHTVPKELSGYLPLLFNELEKQ